MEQDDDNLNFHYNREERIKNAPDNVKDYYDGTMKMAPKGLFKALFYNKSSRFLFVTIIALLAMVFFFSFVKKNNPASSSGENFVKAGNTEIQLSNISRGDKILVNLSFSEDKEYNSEESVVVDFYAVDNTGTVVNTIRDNGLYHGVKMTLCADFTNYEITQIKADFKFAGESYTLISGI